MIGPSPSEGRAAKPYSAAALSNERLAAAMAEMEALAEADRLAAIDPLDEVVARLWEWLREDPLRAGEYEVRTAIGFLRNAQIVARAARMANDR